MVIKLIITDYRLNIHEFFENILNRLKIRQKGYYLLAIMRENDVKEEYKMVKIHHQLDRFQQFVTLGFYNVLKIILSLMLGFLIAKCEIFENFSPFSLILLSVCGGIGLMPTFCYIGSAFGIISGPFSLSVFKYITALTMIYIVHMVFRKSLHVIKNDTAILSAASCFISGFLFLMIDQLTLFNVLILLGESVLICCCVYFINYAVRGFRQSCLLSSRELIAAVITLVLIIITLHNVYIFSMSVARMVALVVLFLAICCFKSGHAAVLGSCLAILLAAVGNGGESIFTAVVVGTLIGCVFSHFSDRMSLTAFLLVYDAILIFFGKFPWNYSYFLEPMAAYALVLFIPKQKLRTVLSAYIPVKGGGKTKDNMNSTNCIIPQCQKECREICPRAEKCYDKNLFELSEGLELLTERYEKTERIDNIEDVLSFCIKPHAMSEIIERQLVHTHSEDYETLLEELEQISKRIERKMDAAVHPISFLNEEENKIKEALEGRRISVKDINFIIDEQNLKKCSIQFHPMGDILYEKIIREVVSGYFNQGFTLKITSFEEDFVAHIRENRCYEISCAALCKTRSNEQISGDTALGFSAGNSYYLILADGMGSGKEAGIQSGFIIDSLRRLITGGLSVIHALNAYRSTLRLRQSNYFTTVDICAINLDTGNVELYKSGAYDSYFVHENKVKVLRGGGIPLGLGEQDRLSHMNIQAEDGDWLILASDGLSALQDDLERIIPECCIDDPRNCAKAILRNHSEACQSNNSDDVTVMVCKISKNTE